jgi:hypothetical protein
LAADQSGATAHRLGTRILAALTGVQVNEGAFLQDALRRADSTVGQAYQ